MKRLIYFFICTLLLPISAKAFDFNKVRNDTIGMFRVDEIKVRPNCIVYRMTDIDAKKYSVVSTCKQYLMIKMTIFPSTSPSRGACTWARSWSSSRASTGMTTRPDSTTLCSCASPRPTRSPSPYAYCANNPVNNVDLDGMRILKSSQNTDAENCIIANEGFTQTSLY